MQEDYGRYEKKRKEYIHQSGLLLIWNDVRMEKHEVSIDMLCGSRDFPWYIDKSND